MLRLKLATRGNGPGSTSFFAFAGWSRLLACLAFVLGLLLIAPAAGSANPITDENALTGTTGWEVTQADAPRIEGYTDKTSYAPGDTVGFHVSLNPSSGVNYRIRIFRLGWYNGAGARLVACIGITVQTPPTCTTTRTGSTKSTPPPNAQTGEIDANSTWGSTPSVSWTVPSTATTGEYVAEYQLVSGSTQNGTARYSPFVVRSPTSQPQSQTSNILVVVPFNTYNAYNNWGGTSAYENTTSEGGPFPPSTNPHATKVSFNRPFARREWRFWDINLLRFLEREGYDVSYVSDTDVDANPSILLQHRTVIVSGHSEYWTQNMRNGFDTARDQGTNIVFAGANNAYWQVRYEDTSCADDNTVCGTVGDRRTMVIYKGPNEGPDDPAPGTANDTSKFRELGRPECELQGGVQYGSWFPNDGYTDYTTTAAGASDPWAAGTGLTQGSIIQGLVGFEFDSFFPDCSVPGTPTVLFQYQGPETSADLDAAAVKYTDNTSGARVFSSGTEQWAWGLDSYRWDPTLFTQIPATNPAIQQFTRNMLADMAKPAAPGGVTATRSGNSFNIDTTPRPDPRISSYRIYRHAGSGSFQPGDPGVTQVCLSNTNGDCTDTPAAGTYRYASVAVDQWNPSTAVLSATVDNQTPPTAVDDSATVSEDAAATAVPVTANDTNPSGQQITIGSVTQPTHGLVTITGGGTGLTYQPGANYCNNPPGTTPDTFTYTINGGSSATVSMTVTCVDDPPVAIRDPLSVVEDDPATALNVTANDADIDGGLMEIISFTQPAHGTVTGVGTANHWTDVRYQPSANYCNFVNGHPELGGPTDDFTYTLNGGSTNTVAMTVDCRDDPANAADDSATVTEDAAATSIPVLSNDSDVEGDPFSIISTTSPAHGTVQVTGGGTGLTYQPNPNYCGPDSFTYTVTGGDTATVSMTVTCVDDPPVAVNDSATVSEDAASTAIPVLANDTDIENDPRTISSATDPAHGTVTLSGGTAGARTVLSYKPDADYCNNPPGTNLDTFQYTINGGSTATVSMTVNCVDDPPVPHNDAASVNEDAAATAVDVLSNDTDVDGGPKTINSVTQPPNGTVVITGGGAGVTYQPNPDYCNNNAGTPDKFTYTLNGGNTGTVSMTVFCVDDPPVASHDSRSVTEDDPATALNVLTNDTDVDGGTKEITSFVQPSHGTVTGVGTAGHWSDLKYQPNANYCNFPGGAPSDDFNYTLNGGSTASVSMTVDCVDDAPVAVNDSATVTEDDGATVIPVMSNDTDVDGGQMGILSVTQPANGTVDTSGGGAVLTYKPNANYCNTPPGTTKDTFSYTLNGGNSATVSMTVNCVDDDPVAVNDSATVTEDANATSIPVLGNDTDIDAGPKTINSVSTTGTHGTVAITGGGSGLTYKPDANYCNTPSDPADTFTYTLNGGSTATVSMTVTCVDDPPHAVDDSDTVTGNSGANSIGVLPNDTDVDGGPKNISSFTQPSHGVVDGTPSGSGPWTDLTYDPVQGYCGPDSFSYTLNGGSSATVSITVDCSGAPSAVDDSPTVTEDDNATVIDVIANDTDTDGGTNTIQSVTQPSNGTVAIHNGGADLTYKPNANYCNTQSGGTPDQFNYTLNGGSTGQVSVTVTCVNDDPTASNDSATVAEDASATDIPVLSNDNDVEGDPITISSVTQPAHGTVVRNSDGGGLTYQPNANYCNTPPGTTKDTFTYTVNGSSANKTATVSMAVTCVDDPPDAVDDSFTVSGNTSSNDLAVLANDMDIDGGPKAISDASDPDHGTVNLTGSTSLTYTPDHDYCGDDTFTYTLTPGGDTATVSVTVDCSQPPDAHNDTGTVTEGDGVTPISVLSNDTDPDGGPKTIESVTQGSHGTVAITGGGSGLSYTLDDSYCNNSNGPPANPSDSFTYTLNGDSPNKTATVSLTINCVDDPPTAVNDPEATATEGSASAVPVLDNDTDIDGGPMKINSATDGAHGDVLVASDGSGLTYTVDESYCDPGNGFQAPANPSDTFTYTLNGGSTGTVSVAITCTDDAPVAVDDPVTVSGNSGASTIQVLGNDTDVDGGPKTIDPALVQEPNHGTVVIASNGLSLTYQPDPGYCSPEGTTDDFDYKLVPGGSTGRVSVTVDCSQPPHAVNDAVTLAQGAPVTAIQVLTNDFDTDGGAPMSITSVTQPANGVVGITGGGTGVTYLAPASYCNDGSPTDNFNYTLNGVTSSTATVAVTVTCAAKSPPPPQQQQPLTDPPTSKKCKKGFKKVKGKCKKIKKKRKRR